MQTLADIMPAVLSFSNDKPFLAAAHLSLGSTWVRWCSACTPPSFAASASTAKPRPLNGRRSITSARRWPPEPDIQFRICVSLHWSNGRYWPAGSPAGVRRTQSGPAANRRALAGLFRSWQTWACVVCLQWGDSTPANFCSPRKLILRRARLFWDQSSLQLSNLSLPL